MPDETVQQKAERQARLSHAMGVMFLQDKVDKLEQDVSKITYPRGAHKTKSSPAAHHSATIVRHDPVKPRAVTGSGVDTTAETSTSSKAKPKIATSIRLVDASVLIFSLRSVHNWSRDGSTCVIIPLEAINTLDLLKKGDEPINLAARKATRWLEDKIAISTQDGNAMLTEPAPGIFAQKEHFRATPAQIAKARGITLAERQSASHAASHDFDSDADTTLAATKDNFSAAEAPRYLRELLSVCLYCHSTTDANIDFAIAIAYPPAHLHDKMLEAQSAVTDKPSYLNRTDGCATEAWLDAYRIPFEVAQTSKTWTGEKPSSRFRGEITGGDQGIGSSEDLHGSTHGYHGQSRGKGSPTPSIASSSGSFRSELSGLSMMSSHRSPRHRQEARFAGTTAQLGTVRGISTFAGASSSNTDAPAGLEGDAQIDSADDEGPIFARPSSAASSHTSFVSSLTPSTHDESSSQTSASHSSRSGAARIVRHAASASPTRSAAAPDRAASPAQGAPRLTSRTLHKTRSGADKMEEYLRRLDSTSTDRRSATATPTPGTPTP